MKALSADELAAEAEGTIVVDIRRPSEWRTTGVIEGSHLLTFPDADVAGWLADLGKIATPQDRLVLVCRTGHRTGILLEFLYSQTDYRHARHLADGILDWIDNGLPVVAVD